MTIYIVFNQEQNEGFVTDDHADAMHAAGRRNCNSYSTAADAFRECYEDETPLSVYRLVDGYELNDATGELPSMRWVKDGES